MNIDISHHMNQQLSALPHYPSFSTWLKQFTPTLTHLAATRQQMILAHYLFSLVSYSNQISLKYFALIDYLIRTFPSFIRAIENIIQSIFTKTYVWFYQNGRFGEVEQMKTFRFSWIGRINSQILYNIKLSIYNWIFVDIDLRGNSNGYQSRPNISQVQDQNLFQEGKRARVDNLHDQQYQRYSQGPMKMRHIQQQNSNTTGSSNTTTSSKVEQKLKGLKMMSPYKCKLCGMQFGQKKFLDVHQKQQIDYRIKQFKENKLPKAERTPSLIVRQSCLNNSIWVDPHPINVKKQQHYFFLKDFNYSNHNCHFCSESFEPFFLDQQGQWVYRDCAKVMIGQNHCPMHKSCYDIIKQQKQSLLPKMMYS